MVGLMRCASRGFFVQALGASEDLVGVDYK